LIGFLEEAERCSACKRIRIDYLPKYKVYPIYTVADCVIHTSENYVVQFEGYFCPFSCDDISI